MHNVNTSPLDTSDYRIRFVAQHFAVPHDVTHVNTSKTHRAYYLLPPLDYFRRFYFRRWMGGGHLLIPGGLCLLRQIKYALRAKLKSLKVILTW